MKTRASIWLMGLMGLLVAGCGTFTVKPGSDPVVVYAEYSSELALQSFDLFRKWERENDVALVKIDPSIHQVANSIRENGKRWIVELRTAISAYKVNRTPEAKTALLAAQGFLDLAIQEIRNATAKGASI